MDFVNTTPAVVAASLRALGEQFVAAERGGYATAGIGRRATAVIEGALAGHPPWGRPIVEAIRDGGPGLDAAAMAFMTTLPGEMQALVGPSFDSDTFLKDVLRAFGAIKNGQFGKLRTCDLDNIQAALTKCEGAWQRLPCHQAVLVVQLFFQELVGLATELKSRLNVGLANDLEPTIAGAAGAAGAGAAGTAGAPLVPRREYDRRTFGRYPDLYATSTGPSCGLHLGNAIGAAAAKDLTARTMTMTTKTGS